MKSPRSRPTAYVAAISLALITLFVFYTLQNFGPESAVRRFNALLQTAAQAAKGGQIQIPAADLSNAVLPPSDGASITFVVQQFAPYFVQGGTFQIIKRATGDSYPRKGWTEHTVLVEVVYNVQGSAPDFAVWVAAQDRNGQWKIDTDLTATARRDVISRSSQPVP